jgi:hypothetical protein
MGEVEKTILYGIATLNYVPRELTRSLVVRLLSLTRFSRKYSPYNDGK